jgi:hypothetical protein
VRSLRSDLGALAAVMLGAVAGFTLVWLTRSRPPEASRGDGWELLPLVYVEPTPVWVYAGSTVLGAAVFLAAWAVRRRVLAPVTTSPGDG